MKIKKNKIIALYSGGDWNDASCDHLIVKKDCDLSEEKKLWDIWYKTEYVIDFNTGKYPKFYDTIEWLIKRGLARKATKKDLLEVWEDEL